MTSGLIKAGNCYSTVGYQPAYPPRRKWGVFAHPGLAQRLALATRPAWKKLNHPDNRPRLQEFERDVQNGRIESLRLHRLGLVPRFYQGRSKDWVTFGIRLFSDNDSEVRAYNEAENLVYSPAAGTGRRIFFGIQGIEVQGLDILLRLSEDHYRVLIGLLVEREGNDPTFSRISTVRLDNRVSLGEMPGTQDGKSLWISEPLLRRLAADPDQFRSSPRIGPALPLRKEE